MFRSIWMWILTHIFKVPTETKQKDIEENQRYSVDYERIDEINFNAIFSNKLANYVINDSNLNIEGNNPRTELLNQIGQSLWKKAKKMTSMGFGHGGLFLIPYVKGKKLFYNMVPQSRVTIDSTEGDLITGITVLSERKDIDRGGNKVETYIRWTNYRIVKNNCIITQSFTNETGDTVPAPEFWRNIVLKQTISNVDRVLGGYIKSPINNRKTNDKYGVPITYGCESTIKEIKETMKQMLTEYRLKKNFVGVDYTMFNKGGELPDDGLYKVFDFGGEDDAAFNIYDPQFRDYTLRLQELFKRLEHQIGTSYGIISEVQTNNATATEIKRALYDTFTLVDDMRSNIEKGLEDFFYACDVLANAYNLTPQNNYELNFEWSYSLIEDPQSEWNQLVQAKNLGIASSVELRQWMNPDEDIEESKKAIEDIKKEEPSVDDLMGRDKGDK